MASLLRTSNAAGIPSGNMASERALTLVTPLPYCGCTTEREDAHEQLLRQAGEMPEPMLQEGFPSVPYPKKYTEPEKPENSEQYGGHSFDDPALKGLKLGVHAVTGLRGSAARCRGGLTLACVRLGTKGNLGGMVK